MAGNNNTDSKKILKGALLGCGSIAPYHLHAWARIKQVDIVALYNRTVSKAVYLAGKFGIPTEHVYGDYDELLEKEEIDFVDIATAPHIHRAPVLAAAKHGKHVLCQKPFAASMNEAREMIEACETANVRCIVNENWRWRSWYRELKEKLDTGIIGKPRYARFSFRADSLLPRPDGELPSLLKVQPYTASMPNLLVYEWGIHLVDVLRFLFGDIHSIYARMGRNCPLVIGEDSAILTLQFKSGLVGLIDVSWVTPISEWQRLTRGNLDPLFIEGDKGVIELDPYRDDAIILTTADGVTQWPARPNLTPAQAYQDSYVNAQQHFADCVLSGELAENEAQDNIKTLAAVFAAYESGAGNRVITLQDYD